MNIVDDRLKMETLRSIKAGETIRISLPTATSCRNASVLAYQSQHILGCKFKVSVDYSKRTVTITRKDKPHD